MLRIISLFLYLMPFIALAQQQDKPVHLFLVGIHSNAFPDDDRLFKMVADSFRVKIDSSYLVDSFATGKELLNLLVKHSAKQKIGRLILLGHSGNAGYFVEKNAGFYTNWFIEYPPGKPLVFHKDHRRISDLKAAMERGKIRFDSTAFIITFGCNTGHGDKSFASGLSTATRLPVYSTIQRVGYYEKGNIGVGLDLHVPGPAFMKYTPGAKGVELPYSLRNLRKMYDWVLRDK